MISLLLRTFLTLSGIVLALPGWTFDLRHANYGESGFGCRICVEECPVDAIVMENVSTE